MMSLGDDESLLKKADLPNTVSSDDPNGSVVELFEIPALKASNSHRRVAGWWDIHWLEQAREGLEEFIESGNSMKLLIGIPIASSLKDLVRAEEESRSEAIANILVDNMKQSPELSQFEKFDLLKWMIKNERIEIKILLVGHSLRKPAAEHAKIQIYGDGKQIVASSGSKNDTRRGNTGGVDFLVVAKSWSSDDSVSQINGMIDYFEKHWNHEEVVDLKDLKNRPEFMEQLEKLAMEHNEKVDSMTRFIRDIGKIKPDLVNAIIIDSTGNKYPTDLPARVEEIKTIRATEELGSIHLEAIKKYIPGIKCVFVFQHHTGDESPPNQNELFRFIFNDGNDVVDHNLEGEGEIDERVLDFFELEENQPEQTEPVEPTTIPDTRHPLVPDAIVNYPYGEKMRDHHVRALSGNHEVEIRRGETKIEGGFLRTKHALFEHATGSGKTGLGLVCAGHMLEDVDFVVIVCPKISIANQWWKQAYDWFSTPDNGNQFWSYTLNTDESEMIANTHPMYKTHRLPKESIGNLAYSSKSITIFVQDTFFHDATVNRLKELQSMGLRWGLIVDEAHRLIQSDKTSLNKMNGLLPSWKLALTASFENRKNLSGTTEVLSWFTADSNIDRYPLASALLDGHLKPFDVEVHLINGEFDLDTFKSASQDYVVGNVKKLTENGPTILFVNEKSVELLDKLGDRIRHEGMNPTSYTYNHQGSKYLQRWRNEDNNPILSLTILDEGVDVSECSGAIMLDSSEDDNRQWIQRRGRTLRKGGSPNAIIHDFAPEFNEDYSWNVAWWDRNLIRLEELVRDSKTSKGKVQTLKLLTEIEKALRAYHG